MILEKHAHRLNLFRIILDPLIVFLAWSLAFFIRFQSGLISMPKGSDTFQNYLLPAPILVITYFAVFNILGLYKRALKKRRVWEEYFDILRAHTGAFFVFVTFTYFLFSHTYSRATLLLFYCLVPLFLAVLRSFIRKASRAYLRKAHIKKSHAIVIGSGPRAIEIEKLIQSRTDWGLEFVKRFAAKDIREARELLDKDAIEVIFIAANTQETQYLEEIYERLGNIVAEMYLIPDFGVSTFLEPKIMQVDRLPAIALNLSSLTGGGHYVKRIYDILFSLTFIIVFSPVFLFCALLVKLASKGPVLYKQERMGIDGKKFNCIKFRGMYVDAESQSGPVWAKKDDDRTTPVGKWLRKTSLDEIPQFFNVLVGDMSVVGPRPERPVFVSDFRTKIPGYMLRHKVKAGITGWAQVNGWRGNTSLEERIACDLWYVQNWSLVLDVKICLLTPFKGFIHPHAY